MIGYSAILGMELGSAARDRAKFLEMNVRDEEVIGKTRDKLVKSFGGLDILVNNAAANPFFGHILDVS